MASVESHLLKKTLKVLGIGQPLLDIIARVDEEFLTVRELASNGMILQNENKLTETIFEDIERDFDVEYVSGGATLNSIRLLQSLLGEYTSASFVGCIGADTSGKRIQSLVKNLGITTSFYESKRDPTGRCAVLISENGDRSMVTSLGASAEFDVDHFHSKKTQHLFRNSQIIYSSGFFARMMPSDMKQFILNNRKIFCLNLAAPWAAKGLSSLFPLADIIFGNDSEFQAISPSKSLATIAKTISLIKCENSTGMRLVIITRGADPTILARNGSVKYFPVDKIDPCDIIDTNGAGDAFVAGFLAGYASGADVDACMAKAHATARKITQEVGVPDAIE